MPRGTRRDPYFDVLFEPNAIGPMTAKNRFYQVPYCNGMGYRDPTAPAWMWGVKAEGDWAVVCTKEGKSTTPRKSFPTSSSASGTAAISLPSRGSRTGAMSRTALMEPPMFGLMAPRSGADLRSRTG